MSAHFGTDGIRGVAGSELTARTAFSLGNALCRLKSRPLVVLGRDTRVSSDMLALSLAAGVAAGGGEVLDGGVLPTAAVAYFVRKEGADFGAVVSASHNPPEFNGLKVFGADGCKLSERQEERAERCFDEYAFAPPIALHCGRSGKDVNEKCGALHPESMRRAVREAGADAGFCYDGDADRLIAADENGEPVDGDKILCIFAKELKSRGRLPHNLAVGTAHTNTGAERELAAHGITARRWAGNSRGTSS